MAENIRTNDNNLINLATPKEIKVESSQGISNSTGLSERTYNGNSSPGLFFFTLNNLYPIMFDTHEKRSPSAPFFLPYKVK